MRAKRRRRPIYRGAAWVRSTYTSSQAAPIYSLSNAAFITQPSIIRVLDCLAGHEAPGVPKFAIDDSGSAHPPPWQQQKLIIRPSISKMDPDLNSAFWKYEPYTKTLISGLPNWMTKAGLMTQDEMRAVWRNWFEITDAKFDWGCTEDVDVDPVFGSYISRGPARMGKSFAFANETMGASYVTFLIG
ncbi:hypothetical protein S7711_11463 [Stachybotrys chartarum IBT 7711]|uniref:Uncharacterized protein n=1 Tax=Stachybotrys chartarum (strain CBS 109288 / IBT 7711) TaxID=1280523 RepID=A0A084B9X2_STACB|nr:hypothetical protein S7711_11463 [Stachybotrys chartarum IBT 7711]